jgi:hypothetical protein
VYIYTYKYNSLCHPTGGDTGQEGRASGNTEAQASPVQAKDAGRGKRIRKIDER